MKRAFLQVIPALLYVLSSVSVGCDRPNKEPAPDINAFDQSHEVQRELDTQAQQTLEMMKQQQVDQTMESINNHNERQSFSPPPAVGGE
ncbi:MAG: hypothetical protein FJ147_08045 [Deltaproteobacteria bacterium]|nr:hypothetical protein [Deltaproteobacteria bacterium]